MKRKAAIGCSIVLVLFMLFVALIARRMFSVEHRFLQAVIDDDTPTVEALIKKGVDVNTCDAKKQSALLLATDIGDVHLIEVLLSHGADIDKVSKYGTTPLMQATYQHKTEVVRSLLDHGANVHKTNFRGQTPLAIARRYQYYDIVDLLVQADSRH